MNQETLTGNTHPYLKEKILMTVPAHQNPGLCIINDSEIIREGLFSLLRKLPNVDNIDIFNRDKLSNRDMTKNYDVIITDVEFQGKIDLEYIKSLRNEYPSAKLIVYTNFNNHEYRNMTIHTGADFFLFMEDKYNLLEHLVTGIVSQIRFKQNGKNDKPGLS